MELSIANDNIDLFGGEFSEPAEENCCATETPAKAKKGGKGTKVEKKEPFSEKLPARTIKVKMYNDFYEYSAPDDIQDPTLEDVRKWMIRENGYTELNDDKMAGVTLITPDEGEPFVYCGVAFQKKG